MPPLARKTDHTPDLTNDVLWRWWWHLVIFIILLVRVGVKRDIITSAVVLLVVLTIVVLTIVVLTLG